MSRSGIVEFCEALFSEGAVRLADSNPAAAEDIDNAARFILQAEVELREHLPGKPPEADPAAVEWVTGMFHRASQLLVYRELGEELVTKDLSVPGPDPGSTNAIYSVDLVFRFLPDLWRIAHAASADDPLVKRLAEWSQTWPLSGIGIPHDGPRAIDAILQHSCLRRMLVDRVIEKQAAHLLADARVRELVRAALGSHAHLAPEITRHLREHDHKHALASRGR
jgi:hypothetical protein